MHINTAAIQIAGIYYYSKFCALLHIKIAVTEVPAKTAVACYDID
jgi:hypothetical protein